MVGATLRHCWAGSMIYVEGWRMVFLIVAAMSASFGCIVALLAADPRRMIR